IPGGRLAAVYREARRIASCRAVNLFAHSDGRFGCSGGSRMIRATPILLAISFVVVGCAPQSSGGAPQPGGQPAVQQRAGPKRITIAIMGDPSGLGNTIDRAGAGGTPGLDAVEEMVNTGLSQVDAGGVLRPVVAEVVPSLENGLWKLLPDGRMETTWRIKPNVQW